MSPEELLRFFPMKSMSTIGAYCMVLLAAGITQNPLFYVNVHDSLLAIPGAMAQRSDAMWDKVSPSLTMQLQLGASILPSFSAMIHRMRGFHSVG